jgi:hypothetical protein
LYFQGSDDVGALKALDYIPELKLFSVIGMAKNPRIGGGISYLSCMVAEIQLLLVYLRHFEFIELGLCQPCLEVFSGMSMTENPV